MSYVIKQCLGFEGVLDLSDSGLMTSIAELTNFIRISNLHRDAALVHYGCQLQRTVNVLVLVRNVTYSRIKLLNKLQDILSNLSYP